MKQYYNKSIRDKITIICKGLLNITSDSRETVGMWQFKTDWSDIVLLVIYSKYSHRGTIACSQPQSDTNMHLHEQFMGNFTQFHGSPILLLKIAMNILLQSIYVRYCSWCGDKTRVTGGKM